MPRRDSQSVEWRVGELAFPAGFLWGTAASAHQTEGGNSNSDWWEWELRPGTPCKEPSGTAIDHYNRYRQDLALLAGFGFNTHRFSVEWARIEPKEGVFDENQLDHYRSMVGAMRENGLMPVATLNHFTLPMWVAEKGGWLAEATPGLFARYVGRVVEAFDDAVDWYNPINEAGAVAFGGYMGALGFPPGTHGVANWRKAAGGLIEGHRQAREAIKRLRPGAQVGQMHSMMEWESNAGGRWVMEYSRRMSEDVYLEASRDDDYVGVNTYTRTRIEIPRPIGWLARGALSIGPLERSLVSRTVDRQAQADFQMDPREAIRRTQMGYEYRPQAIAATVRRVAGLFPGKPILVSEHGVATDDDAERVEYITEGLKALHPLIGEGIPLRGYIHWTGFDNFEWSLGYSMKFGLVAVERQTQERTPKPSAQFLGQVARANKLSIG
jgi:beta-glucosidase